MKILIVGGLLLVIMAIALLPRKIQEYNTYKSGNLVFVTVLGLPNCEFGYKNKFITIKFERKSYSLRTKCKYTGSLHRDQSIQMLHADGTDIFLFPREDQTLELVSNFAIGIVGIIIILIGALKKQNSRPIMKRKTS
ncbi:MAG TPA: hypothetical protein VNT20_23440 [Flavisolibacter sp.]|jgi:hypothetical protein|nr:hypothetical protein [Flavisolibacter sp.]